MTKNMEDFIKDCRNSCFSKDCYAVNLNLAYITSSLLMHTWTDKELELEKEKQKELSFNNSLNKELMERATPKFQRANDKWDIQMKTKFIENLLKGVRVEILLFKLEKDIDAQIIDGLQRTTAIYDFLDGKIKPFGKSIDELKNYLGHFRTDMTIKIYTFSSWEEVGQFYIDMNENITHSQTDIQKAKDYFLVEHGIRL